MTTKLILGDCLEEMKSIKDGSVDAVITDLPYGTTACKWDVVIPFDKMWEQFLRIGKDNAVYVFTASQPFTSLLVTSNIDMFRHEWIWHKDKGSNFANTIREPFKEHESVVVFSRGKWTYNKQMQSRTGSGLKRVKYNVNWNSKSQNYRTDMVPRLNNKCNELRVPSSVQRFNVERGLHPTQKPVSLIEYMIRTYTNEGDVVLDATMGSGTTGVACKRTGRNFIGIEKEAKYYEIAKRRIEEVLI